MGALDLKEEAINRVSAVGSDGPRTPATHGFNLARRQHGRIRSCALCIRAVFGGCGEGGVL